MESRIRSVTGFAAALPGYGPDLFARFDSITVVGEEPAWRAIAVGPILDRSDLPAFEATVRGRRATYEAERYPPWAPFALDDPGSTVAPITLVQPEASRDQVFGFDMASEANRREAIEEARRTGNIQLTRPVALTQDPDRSLRSLLLLQTFYRAPSARQAPWDSVGVVAVSVTPTLLVQEVLDGLELPISGGRASVERGSSVYLAFSLDGPVADTGAEIDRRTAIAAGESQTWRLEFDAPDPGPSMLSAGLPVALAGLLVTIFSALLFMRERGEQARLEGQLAVREAALERSREEIDRTRRAEALGRLTGGIAHDFNNLMSVVLGNLELLESDVDADDASARHYRGQATAAAERAARLTQQLLTLGRQAQLEPKPVSVRTLLLDLEPILRTSVREDVELSLGVPPEDIVVRIDATQLESAILNLVVNARDACGQGDRISVRAMRAGGDDGTGAVVPPTVVLIVEDSGHGMPADVLERATDPFFTTKETGRGTGLGLSTTKGFLEQSGGGLEIESEVGVGTRVTLEIPLAPEASSAMDAGEAARPDPATGLTGVRVLLVEDDAAVRDVLSRSLEARGLVVIPLPSADAAIDALDRGADAHIVVSDVVMPGRRSGLDLAAVARKRGLPCVLVSGYAEGLREARAGGADVTLRKPVRTADLLAAVRGLLAAED